MLKIAWQIFLIGERDVSKNRRVLFLRQPSLLAEGLERLLRQIVDVELIGPWDLDSSMLARLSKTIADIVLIVEEDVDVKDTDSLINRILEQYPGLPLVRIGLREDTIRLYISRRLPARAADLLHLIRTLPVHQLKDVELKT